jgi:glutamine synthetase
MLVQAGLAGIREGLELGGEEAQPLPTSLGEALTLLAASEAAAEWLGPALHSAYVQFKRAEIASLDGLDEEEICRRYALAY